MCPFESGSFQVLRPTSWPRFRVHDSANCRRLTRAVAILACSLTRVVQAQAGITDTNVGAAVTLWATSPTTAAATYGPISDWNTATVTNMASLFANKPTFNGNISSWNVASTSTMYHLFYSASAFNQDVSSWNTASVKTMYQACSFCGFVP